MFISFKYDISQTTISNNSLRIMLQNTIITFTKTKCVKQSSFLEVNNNAIRNLKDGAAEPYAWSVDFHKLILVFASSFVLADLSN